MTHTRRGLLTAVSAAAAVGLAGCTGNENPGAGAATDTDAPATATPAADTTATDADTPTPTDAGTPAVTGAGATGTATASAGQRAYPSYEWSNLEGTEPVATDTVAMSGFAFHPLVATVPPGTTVAFSNEDSSTHSITVPALDVDETVSGGGETSVTFPEAGTFDYVCKFHGPGMLGRVVVEAGVTLDSGGGGGGDGTATATDSGGRGGGYGDDY
ncbi:MAG: cupredoxin domain-containing protein [Halosimplex sp.]